MKERKKNLKCDAITSSASRIDETLTRRAAVRRGAFAWNFNKSIRRRFQSIIVAIRYLYLLVCVIEKSQKSHQQLSFRIFRTLNWAKCFSSRPVFLAARALLVCSGRGAGFKNYPGMFLHFFHIYLFFFISSLHLFVFSLKIDILLILQLSILVGSLPEL